MSVPYYGDFPEDHAAVGIPFNTFTSDDPSASVTITNLVAGDVKIHKDGHVDEKASSDGVVVVIDFDGVTGNHHVEIDTSDDTGAAGFWVTGSEYTVRMEGTTVDGAEINAWIGAFSIERAGGILATLKTLVTTVGAAGVGLTEAGSDGDHLTAINLPNQTMDITGNLSGSVGTCAAATVAAIGNNVITAASINADAITEAKIADNAIAGEHLNATACTKIIDDFETQSQADPTGFHVNVKEVNGTAQTANDMSGDVDANKVILDALTAAAATKLALSTGVIVTGTVSHDVAVATTTIFRADDITEATADHFNGRIVIFTSGALLYQATDITDYALDTGEGKFTVTALTEAPADNVTFIIV